MKDSFPFSAVVGQEEAQLALLLAAVDPAIGGVLLRGDKGSAKSTLARGLAGLLAGEAPFVELPVGATEDRVVGSLDLRAALADGSDRFRPGLLAAAHGGVLYVDEVNLLPDHLVDVLLDVAASGVNRVERDGVSHEHPSRFVLVGSMNPEEGELRPQLLDRFGLVVEVRTPRDPALRAEAVRRRLAHDRAAAGASSSDSSSEIGAGSDGSEQVLHHSRELRERLAVARPAGLPDEVVVFASRLAVEVGAESLRADLVLCRAAAALAGWQDRPTTTTDDVARVAPLALAHRRRRRPFDPPTLPAEDLQSALDQAQAQPFRDPDMAPGHPEQVTEPLDGASHPDGAPHPDAVDAGSHGRPGPDEPAGSNEEPSGAATSTDPPLRRPTPAGPSGDEPANQGRTRRWGDIAEESQTSSGPVVPPTYGPRRPVPVTTAGGPGRVVGERPFGAEGGSSGLAVLPTVRAALLRRAADDTGPLLAADDLRAPMRVREPGRTVVLVVDASGSMGTQARVGAATGAVLGLLADAYLRRDDVALVTFRGDEAVEALPPTRSVELARARLADLPTGGTTPLAAGIRAGLAVALRAGAKGTVPLLVVLTDGRATGSPDALAEARVAAEAVAVQGVDALVLDAEDGAHRLRLAADLASLMHADHLPLPELTSTAVETAIRHHGEGPV